MVFKKRATSWAAVAALGLMLGTAGQAKAAFLGAYDVNNFTLTNNNANGFVNTSGAPNSIVLTGGNNQSFSPGTTDFTIASAGTGFVSFDYNYFTSDLNAFLDPAGFVLNGTFTPIVFDGPGQSGSFSQAVNTNDIFGFRVATVDNTFGRASFTISNFAAPAVAPVPEMSTNLLMGLGLLAIVALQRRKKITGKPNRQAQPVTA